MSAFWIENYLDCQSKLGLTLTKAKNINIYSTIFLKIRIWFEKKPKNDLKIYNSRFFFTISIETNLKNFAKLFSKQEIWFYDFCISWNVRLRYLMPNPWTGIIKFVFILNCGLGEQFWRIIYYFVWELSSWSYFRN